jgi:hypothetical protein
MTPLRLCVALACCVTAALAAPARPASAWGPEGHRIVALIADHVLEQSEPAVRATVSALLARDKSNEWTKTDIAGEATWADVLLDKSEEARTATSAWHFIRLNPAHPDLHRDCFGRPALSPGRPASHGPQDDCIVDKIEQFQRELIDPSTSEKERLTALRFLLNLVGDVHEPLYTIDRGDHGGACVALVIGSTAKPVRLLTYWDETLVAEAAGPDPEAGATKLAAATAAMEVKKWASGSAEEWTRESFEIAKTVAYRFHTDGGRGSFTFPVAKGEKEPCGQLPLSHAEGDYAAKALAAVKMQLVKAGVRLAMVLRDSLK